MPAPRSGVGTSLFGSRSAAAVVPVMVLALMGAGMISGCAGWVTGSNMTPNSGTPNPAPTPSPTPQAQLSASPSSVSFPNVAVGSSSSQTITLQNSGNATATISNVAVTGAGFGTSGLNLPLVIAAGQSSAFNVTFTGATSGSASGSISLTSDAVNGTLTIPTSGNVLAATRSLSSSNTALDFGNVILGTSTSLGASLTNTGNANVTISAVSSSGTGFTVAGVAPNTVLAPGQSTAVSTTFTPTVAGSASGTIAVASDANAVSISLTGNGVQASAHSVALTWDPSTSDVVGYYVYRQSPTTSFSKLNSAPVVVTDFTDSNVVGGESYTYVVTAVDADNVESDYSMPADVTIPIP